MSHDIPLHRTEIHFHMKASATHWYSAGPITGSGLGHMFLCKIIIITITKSTFLLKREEPQQQNYKFLSLVSQSTRT